MTDVDKLIRELRFIIFLSFVVQAVQCVVGATMTAAGMYAILDHAPIIGGGFIFLSFMMCCDFTDTAASRANMRVTLRALHQIRRETQI